ncbi:hypothetical protein Dred_1392 [Desulforamulus reducens MI-1]|uniref:DUF7852 domain-containing protein n=1 Tax=Desulforamulus reducens (strain ATCC BAA-1160 / DSM 100696 / MI-1) TaxID=349161 RepID=A4J4B9_DESRM|nr:hypothetical protein Dred_1392 [Desulforamulus reducens MI-1]
MFNHMTDFFDPKPVKQIQKNVEVEQQELEEPLEETDKNEQVQVESTVSEVQVFRHQKDACVDVTDGNIQSCTNTQLGVMGISDVVVKIPVVLAEFQVQVNINSIITLPEKALEIKEVKKRVKLTQCLLIQEPGIVSNPGDLFIKGFVRKNIAYATRNCSNEEGVCGDIRHCTVDVPFSCVTKVIFNGIMPLPPVANTVSEFEYFRTQNLSGPGFADKDQLLSGDLSEFNQVSQEFYNELPFCELICSKIIEFDEFLNRKRPCDINLPFEEREFSQIEEKMVLYLTIKLLQNHQVYIPPVHVNGEIRNETSPVESVQLQTLAHVVIEEDDSTESIPELLEEEFLVEETPDSEDDLSTDISSAAVEDDHPVDVDVTFEVSEADLLEDTAPNVPQDNVLIEKLIEDPDDIHIEETTVISD